METAWLRDHFYFARTLAVLHEAEWRHLYKHWGAERALREFDAEHADGTIPATIIALEGDHLLGSISVIQDDLPGWTHLNPWVASFFVLPEHRRRGVGTFLFRAAETLLQENGLRRAYLFTETAEIFFIKQGWHFIEPAVANGTPVRILSNLPASRTNE